METYQCVCFFLCRLKRKSVFICFNKSIYLNVWLSPVLFICVYTCSASPLRAPAMLSGATIQGTAWHFPPWRALGVELEPNTSISELLRTLLQPFSSVIPLSFPNSFCCGGAVHGHTWTQAQTEDRQTDTHTHTHTHIWGADGRALPVKKNWSAALQGLCVCACVCVIDVSSLFYLRQTAPCMITPMLSEREGERNGFLGNITRSPLCRAFTCWASNSLPSTEKNSGNTKKVSYRACHFIWCFNWTFFFLKKGGLFTVSSNNRFEIRHRALLSHLQMQRAKATDEARILSDIWVNCSLYATLLYLWNLQCFSH